MDDRIIICKKVGNIVTAVFRENVCFRLFVNPASEPLRIGNIYTGRIASMVPNINACFTDIGIGENVYIPLEKLKNAVISPAHADGKIHQGDSVLVQIDRLPAKQKKAGATGDLSFVGNAVVLLMGRKGVSFSKKIDDPGFRDRMRSLFEGKTEAGFGVMLRTNAPYFEDAQILSEYETLRAEFKDAVRKFEIMLPGTCLREDLPEYLKVFRDEHLSELTEIVTDDESVYSVLRGFFTKFLPELSEKVRLYKEDTVSLYHLYDLTKAFHDALSRTVSLKSGGNIVFDRTEAMTVADVNSGRGSAAKKTALSDINREAAREIARQMELRGLSGMILCDFISCGGADEKKQLFEYMKECTRHDRSVDVVDITRLGIMEITREKLGAPLYEVVKNLDFNP
ncbi:MAG: ribonuclease E/G [Lachnospiraceae bacterium]|nr:ribonuclease E/G [Lachnospiraceae bacterium]